MRMRTIPAVLLLFLHVAVAAAASSVVPAYELQVSKSQRLLQVTLGGQVVRTFNVAHGKGGTGAKRHHGDNKTPVGSYRVVEFKADSRFHYFMQLGYPNMVDAWHGYRNEVIDGSEFRAIAASLVDGSVPPQDTPLGGYIGIHGIGDSTPDQIEVHQDNNWTEGCIALTNGEIDELREYVAIGTRVIITE